MNRKIIVRIGIVVAVLLLGYFLGRPSKKELRAQYERGAHLSILHYQKFDDFPSIWFRDIAFEWGDPQSKADLDAIDEIIMWEILNNKRYKLTREMRDAEIGAYENRFRK